MKDILVVVDMQNDFINGSLGTKEAVEIVKIVKEEILKRNSSDVIFTKDTHHEDYLNTSEGKNLPIIHCVKNTLGWELNDEIKEVQRDSLVIEKPTFGSYELIDVLSKLINSKDDSITFVGLCTDICVISNAVLAKAKFYENKIVVLKDAVAGVTTLKNEEALDVMKSLQIEVK